MTRALPKPAIPSEARRSSRRAQSRDRVPHAGWWRRRLFPLSHDPSTTRGPLGLAYRRIAPIGAIRPKARLAGRPGRDDGVVKGALDALRRIVLLLALLLAALPARAAIGPDEILPDPAMEARAREITKQLRCLVCQNQSIDDSNAPLARDLRLLVRERLKAGDSDAATLAYVVARYGDFVLLRPPVKATTWLLWFGPLALLLGAALFLSLRTRRKSTAPAAPAPLSEDEQKKLAALMEQKG